jgi:hypothetical protein
LLGCDNVESIAMKKGNFICGIGNRLLWQRGF